MQFLFKLSAFVSKIVGDRLCDGRVASSMDIFMGNAEDHNFFGACDVRHGHDA